MKMTGNRIIEFEEEGVIFILPEDKDHLYVKREELGETLESRPVIRVSILDTGVKDLREGQQNILTTDMTLIVYYNYDDLIRAKKAGREKPNIIIDSDEVPDILHIYHTVSGSRKWVGYMMVKMNREGDPLISVGP